MKPGSVNRPCSGAAPVLRGDPPKTGAPLGALWLFATLFGIVEAALVADLRFFLDPDSTRFPFVRLPGTLLLIELVREGVTLVLLATVARLAVRRPAARFAAFLDVFGIWDLVYYVGLRFMLGWPRGLTDWDLLFLLPVPWLGPVYAPLILALTMVGVGGATLRHDARYGRFQVWPRHLLVAGLAGLACISSFTIDPGAVERGVLPSRYPIELLALGLVIGMLAWADLWRRNRRLRHLTG
ncbi:MAG: hypothetical protein ACE5G2_11505 [Candidatus Krumholzibacteriia bacterium]